MVVLYSNQSFAQQIIISVEELVYDNFMRWTSDKKVDEINNYNTIYSNKGTVELILLHQALKASEEEFEIKLIPTSNIRKERYLVASGVVHIAAQCLWYKNINKNDFFVSHPVLGKGEYEKGIYALRKNRAVFKIKTVEDLRKFKAIVLKNENPDLSTLKAMNIKDIIVVPDLKNIYSYLYHKKADFVLLNLSENNDFSRSFRIKIDKKYGRRTVKIVRKVKLYPIKNIKIGLQGSLHYITTKKSINAENVNKILDKGIKALLEKKLFKKAFTESRSINYRVIDWKQIF
jgi:hypothetical protein